MRVILAGSDRATIEKVALSIRMPYPDLEVEISDLIKGVPSVVDERSFDIVVFCPDGGDPPVDTIKELRGFSDIPIFVFSLENSEESSVASLMAGADDYIRIPFGIAETAVRVSNTIKRRIGISPGSEKAGPILSGELQVNPNTYEVFLGNEKRILTVREFDLLYLLMRNRGTIVEHRVLGEKLWGEAVDSSSLVKKYIQRLRKKLGDNALDPHWIANVSGVGYRFVGPPIQDVIAGES